MARVIWETIKSIECERVHAPVALMEKRVYLGDSIADTSLPSFHTLNYCCSEATLCNLMGCKCRWSCLNSDYDPFQDAARLDERVG